MLSEEQIILLRSTVCLLHLRIQKMLLRKGDCVKVIFKKFKGQRHIFENTPKRLPPPSKDPRMDWSPFLISFAYSNFPFPIVQFILSVDYSISYLLLNCLKIIGLQQSHGYHVCSLHSQYIILLPLSIMSSFQIIMTLGFELKFKFKLVIVS